MDEAEAQQLSAEAAPEGEAMEVEEALPNGTAGAAPAGTAGGMDDPALAGDEAMASASASVQGGEAFDMWAAQVGQPCARCMLACVWTGTVSLLP